MYTYMGKSHGQRNLVGYSPWGRKRVRHDLEPKQQYVIYNLFLSLPHYSQNTLFTVIFLDTGSKQGSLIPVGYLSLTFCQICSVCLCVCVLVYMMNHWKCQP